MSSSARTSSESAETPTRAPAEALRLIAWLAALNLAWEIAQLPFYTLWHSESIREIAFAIVHCTAGDVTISLFSGMAALLFVRMRWPHDFATRLMFVSMFILVSLAYTIYSEWLNVHVEKSWAYSDIMPVLPPFGTGLTPVLQWIIVPVIAWQLARQRRVKPKLKS